MKVELMLNIMHGALAFKVNGQPFRLIRERWHTSKTTRDSGSSHRSEWVEVARFTPTIIAAAMAIATGLWELINGQSETGAT